MVERQGEMLTRIWEDLCADEAIWPRVLTPIDGALAFDANAVALPPTEFEAIGLAGAAPPTSPVGPQVR
jgi:hypothetical protein